MNQIRDLVKKYDLFLFSDEVYREFIYTGSPYISACHLEGQAPEKFCIRRHTLFITDRVKNGTCVYAIPMSELK